MHCCTGWALCNTKRAFLHKLAFFLDLGSAQPAQCSLEVMITVELLRL